MTVLEALAILETAVLECKKRDINTPEVHEALTLLEPHIQPEWLIPQFRHHALNRHNRNEVDREGQQQVLRATFPWYPRFSQRVNRKENRRPSRKIRQASRHESEGRN
jgi:hypothetical protein